MITKDEHMLILVNRSKNKLQNSKTTTKISAKFTALLYTPPPMPDLLKSKPHPSKPRLSCLVPSTQWSRKSRNTAGSKGPKQ